MAVEYKVADESVRHVMHRVIRQWPAFEWLSVHGVDIEVIMAWSEDLHPVKVHGFPAAGKIKIVGGEERSRGGPDARIILDGTKYGDMRPESREALFAHELYHLQPVPDDKGDPTTDVYGRPKLRMRPSDWCHTGFVKVAQWYGDISLEVRSHRAVAEKLSQLALPFPRVTGASVGDGALLTLASTDQETVDAFVAAAMDLSSGPEEGREVDFVPSDDDPLEALDAELKAASEDSRSSPAWAETEAEFREMLGRMEQAKPKPKRRRRKTEEPTPAA